MEKDKTIRVNIRISEKLKRYFEERSLETGVAQSALMALALEEYMYQRLTQDFMTKLDSEKINKIIKDWFNAARIIFYVLICEFVFLQMFCLFKNNYINMPTWRTGDGFMPARSVGFYFIIINFCFLLTWL